jgi:iron(III) transport system ATP-binding protein
MANEGAAAPSFLRITGLRKSFGPTTVVRDVDLDMAAAEFVCVLGPSGCGKTTLLRLIAGFEQADSGRIVQAGRDVTRMPPERRDYGIVFQSYALFPNRTVRGNISFGLEATGVTLEPRNIRIEELLTLVGLNQHANKYPSQLSGGQQQRVALARALALSPGLLLLDEPLSALDANVRAHLRDELRALQRRVGVAALMVTHDQHEALSIADRLVVMNAGRIEQVGTPAEVYQNPANLFVGRFLGDMNAAPVLGHNDGAVVVANLPLQLEHVPEPWPVNASLCIRPAAVTVGADAKGAANAFGARLVTTKFLGDMMRLRLQGDAWPSQLDFYADVPVARLAAMPAVGDMVDVALAPRHLIVLPGDG